MANSNDMRVKLIVEATTQQFQQSIAQAQADFLQFINTANAAASSLNVTVQASTANLAQLLASSGNGLATQLTQLSQDVQALHQSVTATTAALNAMGNPAGLSQANQLLQQLVTHAQQAHTAMQGIGNVNVVNLGPEITRVVNALSQMQTVMQSLGAQAQQTGTALHNALNQQTGTLSGHLVTIQNQLTAVRADANATGAALQAAMNLNTSATMVGLREVVEQLQRMQASAERTGQELRDALQAQRISSLGASAQVAGESIDALTRRLRDLAMTYIGIQGLENALRRVIQTTIEFQAINQQLVYSQGSAAKAAETFAYLMDVSNKLGLEVTAASAGFAGLSAATKGTRLEGEATRTLFEGITKAIAVMHLAAADAQGVFRAISQIASKGVVSMEELRQQLGERLPPVMQLSAKAMGITTAQLNELVSSGNLASETFLKYFGPALVEAFSGAEKNAETLQGQINILSNSFKILLNQIGEQISGGLSEVFSDLGEAFRSVQESIDSLDPVKAAAIREAMLQLYEAIKTTFGTALEMVGLVMDGFDDLSIQLAALTGSYDANAEKVGFLTRVMQGLSIALGVISDGVKFVGIAFEAALGDAELFSSGVAYALSKITFGDVSRQLQQVSDDLRRAGDEHLRDVDAKLMAFESNAAAALDSAAKTGAERYGEMTDASLKKLQEMWSKQTTGTKVATDEMVGEGQRWLDATLKAHDGVLSSDDRLKLSQFGLQAEADKTGKIIVSAMAKATEATATNATQVERLKTSYGEVGVTVSQETAKVKKALDDLARDAGISFDKPITKSADLAMAIAEVGSKSAVAADRIRNTLALAIKDLNTTDAVEFGRLFADGLQKAGASGEQFGRLMLQVNAQIAKSMKVDIAESMTGLSDGFKAGEAAVASYAQQFDSLRSAGVDAAHLIKDSLTELTRQAKNPAEINEAIALWEEYGRRGVIANRDVADAVEAARLKLEKMTPGIQGVTEAFKLLGLETQRELRERAADLEQAYYMVRNSGQATAGQLRDAFEKAAAAAAAAGNSSFAELNAGYNEMTASVDRFGKLSTQKWEDVSRGAKSTSMAITEVSSSYGTMASAAEQAAQSAVQSMQAQIQKADELASKLRGAQVNSAGNLSGVSMLGYGSADAVKALLLSSGYSGKDAASLAKDIFQGSIDEMRRQPIGQQSLTNAAIVEREVQRILSYNTKGTTGMIGSPADYGISAPATPRVPDSAPASTTRLELVGPNGQTVTAAVPQGQDSQLIGMLTQLGIAKQLSGA